jgi:hypothetical protein
LFTSGTAVKLIKKARLWGSNWKTCNKNPPLSSIGLLEKGVASVALSLRILEFLYVMYSKYVLELRYGTTESRFYSIESYL